MKWIIDDLKRAWAQLKRWQTWLTIGLLGLFALLAWLIAGFAFRTDAVLLFLHRTAGSCRQMNNGTIIFMFGGMIFFVLSAVLTLGEFQRWIHFRQIRATAQARQALTWGIVWSALGVGIAAAALAFFMRFCR